MAKIPEKNLRWRRKQKKGAIMTPEKFKSIEAGVRKSGSAYDPKAVAGAKYWEEEKKKYRASTHHHSPATPL